jgi:crossover junction endodeoxyribonuclease RuvC
MATKRRIMGIDPGTNILGYGVLEIEENKLKLLKVDVLKMSHLDHHTEKLKEVFINVQYLIKYFQPTELAIEAPFYGKNVQVMLKLGRTQGVAMAAALAADLPVTEYLPKKVKQSVTGRGSATKEQVAAMVENALGFKVERNYLDATDALAVALCHYYQTKQIIVQDRPRFKDWKDFIGRKK